MPTEGAGGEQRQTAKGGGAQSHPAEPENLPCPRCDSTKTKFCYYNNYNLSQPRYFCKSCRRYWTRGGTLRNIPVGGGSRKSSKRSRSSSSSSAATAASTQPLPSQPLPAVPIVAIPSSSEVEPVMKSGFPSPATCDLNLNPNEGSFTSLLTANAVAIQGGEFLEYGVGQAGFEEVGLGFDFGYGYGCGPSAAESHVSENDAAGGNDSHDLQLGGSDDGIGGYGGGGGGGGAVYVMDGVDYFAWPDLTISTAGKGSE